MPRRATRPTATRRRTRWPMKPATDPSRPVTHRPGHRANPAHPRIDTRPSHAQHKACKLARSLRRACDARGDPERLRHHRRGRRLAYSSLLRLGVGTGANPKPRLPAPAQPSPDEGLRRATHVADGELDNESAAPAAATTEQPVALDTQTASPGNSDTTKDDPWRCARTPGARGCERRHGEDLVIAQPDIHAAPGGLPAPAEAARSCRIQCDGQWHRVSCASDAEARCDCHAEPVAQCVDKPL